MRVKVTDLWRLLGGCGAAIVVASGAIAMQPYPVICTICANPDGNAPWWMCLLCW